eukprot:maker-scaffold142_size315517-snap-gene-1.10 protein:Tk07697 transcript:maker-scaffold142_size315517-snap-gene-1.10-mRNA-1 annotation:"hypothetical protein DAPPUDRAFT_214208"
MHSMHMQSISAILLLVLASPSTSQRFDLSSLSLRAAAQNGAFNCADKDTQFELVTGYVYTAPDDMLDSRPGTLMLTDCIELCRRNTTCKSANFETGLCVLFGSSAEEFPGGLTASQFPVFTLYVQKICLTNVPSCERAWTFEKVDGFAMDKYAKKRGRVSSRLNCEMLCLAEKEFPCRSATYNAVSGDCRISDMDRHTVASTGDFIESVDDQYLENNCVDDPVKLCDFQLLENRIMKTVDSVYQDVPTMEACRDLCLTAPYRCHSFDYGDTGERVCRLSHHTSTTLTQIQEPFLIIEDVVGTYELSSCYNVTIDCRAADMIATVRTNKIFNGKIYAKDNPNSCVVDVENGIEFSIKMAYNDIECNVKRKAQGVYSNEVIIQHHDSIVTSADLGLALNCQYDLSNRTIINDFDLSIEGEIEPSLFEEAVVESPNVLMKITKRGGDDVDSAQVGDALELRFEIFDEKSPYEIFVRDLIAKDGNDQNQIVLLDSEGCPAEGQIMGPLIKDETNPKVLVANFDAFKFPTSQVVQFRAHVTPCMPICEPVECVYTDYYGGDNTKVTSYGRKKRSFLETYMHGREKRSYNNNKSGKDLLVTQAFVVVDKFNRTPKPSKPTSTSVTPSTSLSKRTNVFQAEPTSTSDMSFGQDTSAPSSSLEAKPTSSTREPILGESSEICLNAMGIIMGLCMFLVAQLIIVCVVAHFWQKRRKLKKEDEAAKNMFNPYAHRR